MVEVPFHKEAHRGFQSLGQIVYAIQSKIYYSIYVWPLDIFWIATNIEYGIKTILSLKAINDMPNIEESIKCTFVD